MSKLQYQTRPGGQSPRNAAAISSSRQATEVRRPDLGAIIAIGLALLTYLGIAWGMGWLS